MWSAVWQEAEQVLAVAVLGQRLGQLSELLGGDEAVAPCNFFGAGNLQALAAFQGDDELAGFQLAVVRADTCIDRVFDAGLPGFRLVEFHLNPGV